MTSVIARAGARVGLLGNPSDIYGGRALALGLRSPGARVELRTLERGSRGDARGPQPEGELLAATRRLFRAELGLGAESPEERAGCALDARCDVPFQSGLSGSSAIVLAALVALARHHGVALAPTRLAELAWLVETRELGLLAGPMDRLAQAHGGLVWMDCARAFDGTGPEPVVALDPALLPPLVVAWHREPGEPSGSVHAPVHERWRRGDPEVRAAMEELAGLADAGREALERGRRDSFCDLVERNFELRASLFELERRDLRLVAVGRAAGAAVKFCGSGGSVVAVPREGGVEPVRRAYLGAGCEVLCPEPGPGAAVEQVR